jgi:hypothetical protein
VNFTPVPSSGATGQAGQAKGREQRAKGTMWDLGLRIADVRKSIGHSAWSIAQRAIS